MSGVKEDTAKKFKYIQLPSAGRRYFCLQQSLVACAWILYFHDDVLSPISRPVRESRSLKLLVHRIRNCVGQWKSHAKSLVVFALYKYQWRKVEGVVELSQYGQVCLPVHQGHKIFDLRRNATIKVFDSDVHISVMRGEIELLKRISPIGFAPALKKWNLSEKWYEEEFLDGSVDSSYKPLDSVTLLKKFQEEVEPCLKRLVLFKETSSKNALEYVNEIILHSGLRRPSNNEIITRDFLAIENFLDAVTKRLVKEENCSIDLVFAHGDFVPANMLNASQGMKVIDWENSGCRSALFDFYSYFFYRPVARKVPVQTVLLEINQALPIFLESLSKNSSDLSCKVRHIERVYRWIFYIEMLCRLIEREVSDKNLDILNCIRRYIDVFNEFERLTPSHCSIGDSS